MNDLQIFNNEEFGNIRTVTDKVDAVWFVGRDVALALGYSNITDALQNHVDDEDKHLIQKSENTTFEIPNRGMMVINESGLYSLVLSSKLPNAKKFKRWVTSEVIPSIRKNGGYISGQGEMNEVELMAKALQVANKVIERRDFAIKLLEQQIEEDKPKVDFFDTVAESKTAISMNEVAKVLDMGIGRNKLFEFLREDGVLDRRNVPYQKFVDAGWFRVIEQSYMRNSEPVITTKTLVYQKGVDGIRKRLIKARNE